MKQTLILCLLFLITILLFQTRSTIAITNVVKKFFFSIPLNSKTYKYKLSKIKLSYTHMTSVSLFQWNCITKFDYRYQREGMSYKLK